MKKHKDENERAAIAASLAAASEQHWHCAIPIEENTAYHFIAEKNGTFKRVLAKAIVPYQGLLHIRDIMPCKFDTLAAFDPFSKTVYFVNAEVLEVGDIALKLTKSKEKLRKIRYADDFTAIVE